MPTRSNIFVVLLERGDVYQIHSKPLFTITLPQVQSPTFSISLRWLWPTFCCCIGSPSLYYKIWNGVEKVSTFSILLWKEFFFFFFVNAVGSKNLRPMLPFYIFHSFIKHFSKSYNCLYIVYLLCLLLVLNKILNSRFSVWCHDFRIIFVSPFLSLLYKLKCVNLKWEKIPNLPAAGFNIENYHCINKETSSNFDP